MPRLSRALTCLLGFVAAAGLVALWEPAWAAAQQKVDPTKKVDPKKTPDNKTKTPDPKAKTPDPKGKTPEPKPQPKPKPADPKSPAPKEPQPDEPPPPLPLGTPNPLDLVRGLRDQGMADLALEYLRDLEAKPLPAAVKAELPLERAKCLLEAADDEPDEGTRVSLIGEAKDGFTAFLKQFPTHDRATEAYLALARLAALDAKAQLARARRIDVPAEEGKPRDEAVIKQKAEAKASRKLFDDATKQFKGAADRLKTKLAQPKLDPQLRRALVQAKFDAELAAAVNQFSLGDTYLHATANEKKERSDLIEKARQLFAALSNDPATPPRVAYVAQAWMAECEYEKENFKVADDAFNAIEKARSTEADDGKRLVGFFQIRHKLLKGEFPGVERDARAWLSHYGTARRAQAEAVAVRWYLGLSLFVQAEALVGKTKTPPAVLPGTARTRYAEAEKLFRVVSQTDNEYAHRATNQRMATVRRLLGEADKPPAEYKTFEDCQMASLIQMSKLLDAEKDPAKTDEAKARRLAIVALLERARGLATDKDSPADVSEVLIRLIYYYQQTDQPYQAAVLGEYVARTVKSTGGKSSVAGVLGLLGYTTAAGQIKTTEADKLEVARRADRDRAVRLARFLDEKFPNDTATDRARHRLAGLLYEDGKVVEAYDALLKVRAGYDQIGTVRLFQGAVAQQLLAPKDSPLPDARKRDVFRRTVADLDKVAKPAAEAEDEDVRTYLSARCRLALLYLLQPRLDPETEKKTPGYPKARVIAEDAMGLVPSFTALVKEDAGTKTPNLDGWEMKLLAEDARTRAVFLEGQALFVAGKYEEVFAAIGPVLAEMNEAGTFAAAVQKAGDAPPPKKGAAPKKGKDDEPPADDPDAGAKARAIKTAEGVDKVRRDLIVLALKARVKQGQADKAAELLDLLKKYGGNIEANVATLQQLTTEMAAQIIDLRKTGKADEAQALSDGFAKLLDRVSAEPNLPPAVQLFLGQSLSLVGDYAKAEEMLKKVPSPADRTLLAKPLGEVKDDAVRLQILLYRRATLELVRAFRLARKYPEGDALLQFSMGTPDKQEWAFNSLDFRKEMALLYEARGADEANVPLANKLWGEAVKEWTLQFNLARARLSKEPPKGANDQIDNAAVQRNKNAYFEAFFEYNRCIVKANMQLRKGSPKLQETFDSVGKKFVDVEKTAGEDMVPEVRAKYAEFLLEVPELKKAYEAAGGKQFTEKPAATTGGM
jgi:hypothetical protein